MGIFSIFGATVGGGRLGAGGRPTEPFEVENSPTPANPIDVIVFAQLKKLKIRPAHFCSDAVFVRRAYLDAIGTLPTADEARKFLDDSSANKRQMLVRTLLERSEFADYWAMKWCDLLRVKAEFPINLWPNAVQAYSRWIRTSIAENKPYDRFVREMLIANGSSFRVAPVNFYRAMQNREPAGIAQMVALTFMGTRTDGWPKDRLANMARFFSRVGYKSTAEWKEEIVYFDREKAGGDPIRAAFPDGTNATLTASQDPRELFADWLIDAKNPWFARNIANRLWAWLMGRGIIHEPDDIRPDNPPSNPELLNLLEKQVVASRYDLKKVMQLILSSRTYQLSSIGGGERRQGQEDYARYQPRRLEAEVLIDALCQITGTTEEYSSAIPEPYTFVPGTRRSICLADGSITSSFLEMFGRSSRDTGLESERNNRPTPTQRLHLLNSSHIQRKLERAAFLKELRFSPNKPWAAVERIYLTILSRRPTRDELAAVQQYAQRGQAKGREIAIDLCWALINSAEFQYRH